MNVSTDDNDDDRHGALKLGVAYRFLIETKKN